MAVVTLDSDLKKRDIKLTSKKSFLEDFTDFKEDYSKKITTQSTFYVRDNIIEGVYHKNYLEYLELCWASHRGAHLTPDIFWYTILSELSLIVNKDPENYRHLFTDSPEKKTIVVLTEDPVELPIHLIIGQLQDLVPVDADVFMPNFSTTTDRAKTAQRACFAEMVSPYYDYCMLLCGIPYIDVKGSERDWLEIGESLDKVADLFKSHGKYFTRLKKLVSDVISNLKTSNSDFWRNMFALERCGSGHQTEVKGWFADLYLEKPRTAYVCNFSTHVSSVDYENLSTKRKFTMKQGLFSSVEQDEFYAPEFGCVILERKEVDESPMRSVIFASSSKNPGYDDEITLHVESEEVTPKKSKFNFNVDF